jgi:hypothetical protein
VNAASMDSRAKFTHGHPPLHLRQGPHRWRPMGLRCSFCGQALSPFARLGPLRCGS